MINTPVSLKRQSGFAALMALVILLAVTSAVSLQQYDKRQRDMLDKRAEEAGVQLQQYAFAAMRYLSENGVNSVPGTYTGANWLKDSTLCAAVGGSASRPYLPDCSFRDTNSFGAQYSSVVAVDGASGVASVTISIPFPQFRDNINGYLASLIRNTAASSLAGSTPVSQTFSAYSIDSATNQITARVATSPSTDIWYRTDGSNKMNADANFGGNSLYGVSAIYGANTATVDLAETISIGNALNVAGVLSVGTTTENTYVEIFGADSGTNLSLTMEGGLASAFADFAGNIRIGDGTSPASSAQIIFFDSNSNRDVQLYGRSSDLFVTNADGDATLVADRVYDKNVNRFLDQALFNITMVANGSVITKPSCVAGTVPQIFTAVAGLAQSPGRPITAFRSRAVESANSWMIKVDLKTDGPNMTPDSQIESDILVAVKCS